MCKIKLKYHTFEKTTSWYPKTQQKQQKQHFPKNVDFCQNPNFSTFFVKKWNNAFKSGQNFFERVLISLHLWPMLFGQYLAGNSICWHIYVTKFFFWGQKIPKNRFSKNRCKSHIYVKIAYKTCLGTPKSYFLAIYTYISHYLILYKKSKFWQKSRFFRILTIFDNSKFGRLDGRKWPESKFVPKNIFFGHFKSLFI